MAILNLPFENSAGDVSTITKDYSGFGGNATVSGATFQPTGGYDGKGAYNFDGSNDQMSVGNAITETFQKRDWTVAFWFKPDAKQTDHLFSFKGGSYRSNNCFRNRYDCL